MQPYRMIIVDDEDIIREGVARRIAWGENGFDLAGVFADGQQALDFLRKEEVDVVLSDIYMPKMNGLELSRVVAEEFPETVMLLLSGYDDFEYAQAAVKHQVRQFLLKPITAGELAKVFSSLKGELDERRQSKAERLRIAEKLSESFPLLRERFFNRLIRGSIESEQRLAERSEYLDWKNLMACYQVLLLRIPESWSEWERLAFLEDVKPEAAAYDELFFDKDENLVALLQDNREEDLALRFRDFAKAAFFRASAFDKEQISVGCGKAVDHWGCIPLSYTGARKAVEYSAVMGMTQIVSIHEIADYQRISLEGFNFRTRQLVSLLKDGGREEITRSLEAVFQYLSSHIISGDELAFYLTRLHYLLYYFVRDMELFKDEDIFFSYSKKTFSSISQARPYFMTMLSSIDDRIHSRRNDLLLSRLHKAKEIIAKEYGNSSFSLKEMCNRLYLSTSQFSQIFKEGTGKTFVEYLSAYRVEKAKELLKTSDMKVYAVAEAVGLKDPRYFSLVFKKYAGQRPLEYRKQLEV